MRVLVIRHGALGDVVLSLGPFAAIRAHHPDARITLLTTAPYAAFARAMPFFDSVAIDPKPEWWNLAGIARLARTLRGFDLVYDLQTSARSSRYHWLAGRPPWSGIARGCSHPDGPGRDLMHTLDRQRRQLERAGITRFPAPALDWAHAAKLPPEIDATGEPVLMLVPGASSHRPEKRWPAASFRIVAREAARRGIRPVVAGGGADWPLAAEILDGVPGGIDLVGRTDLVGLARLALRARLAIGNDTGPMHVASAMGCPSIVLFSAASDPALTAPRGTAPVEVIRERSLAAVPPGRVVEAMTRMLASVTRTEP